MISIRVEIDLEGSSEGILDIRGGDFIIKAQTRAEASVAIGSV